MFAEFLSESNLIYIKWPSARPDHLKEVLITMTKQEQVEKLTRYMANFVSHIGKKLPDDIIAKLDELAD